MKEEIYRIIWGTGILVLGLIVLMFVFMYAYSIAQNPSEKLDEWAPEEIKGPTASFGWSSLDTSVDFNDDSLKGDGEIISWYWEFGDGSSSEEKNPHHEYSVYKGYTVSLEVEDGNGKTGSADTIIQVEKGSNDGHTEEGFPFDLGIGDVIKRASVAILVIGVFAVLVMIGGRIAIAGVHLLKPTAKTLKIKVKHKDMEVELPSTRESDESQAGNQT